MQGSEHDHGLCSVSAMLVWQGDLLGCLDELHSSGVALSLGVRVHGMWVFLCPFLGGCP